MEQRPVMNWVNIYAHTYVFAYVCMVDAHAEYLSSPKSQSLSMPSCTQNTAHLDGVVPESTDDLVVVILQAINSLAVLTVALNAL